MLDQFKSLIFFSKLWTAKLSLNLIQIYKFGWIQTSQTGGQQYSDTSPYKVSECSLTWLMITHNGRVIVTNCYCNNCCNIILMLNHKKTCKLQKVIKGVNNSFQPKTFPQNVKNFEEKHTQISLWPHFLWVMFFQMGFNSPRPAWRRGTKAKM